jgi:hypothetical protein
MNLKPVGYASTANTGSLDSMKIFKSHLAEQSISSIEESPLSKHWSINYEPQTCRICINSNTDILDKQSNICSHEISL